MADARVASAPLAHCAAMDTAKVVAAAAAAAAVAVADARPLVDNGHAAGESHSVDASGSVEATSAGDNDSNGVTETSGAMERAASDKETASEDLAAEAEAEAAAGEADAEDAGLVEIVAIDEDDEDDEEDDEPDVSAARGDDHTAMEPHARSAAEESGSRRRRKRSRRLGFSGSRSRSSGGRQRRLSEREDAAAAAAAVAAADDDAVVLSVDADGGLYPPPPPGEPVVAWQWSTCDEYFAPITQRHLDDLVALRRDAANMVAANAQGPAVHADRPWLAALLRDATDHASSRLQRTLRRGRYYRDVWDEGDAVAGERRGSRSSKKRPLAGCEVVPSLRALVRGYDDDRFEDYVSQLERHAASAADAPRPLPSPPPPPADDWHPAAWGAWRLAADASRVPSEVVHPASLARSRAPRRWKEEREQEMATATTDRPTVFGSAALEEDEIARELAQAVTHLVALSALNWRTAQTLYERAATGIACAPVLAAEAAAERRLEALYREIFPPRTDDGGDDRADDDAADDGRRSVVCSRTADLVAFGARCGSGETAVDPTHAAAVSVEFALRLQRGDEVDVLDRHGCWSDGVVLELLADGGGSGPTTSVKFVRVAVEHGGVEWIAVTEARLLPRGVADGRASFLVGPSRVRRSRVEISRAEADALAQSWAARRARHEAALDPRHATLEAADRKPEDRNGKASKRQRKR
ncbi:hypothetical protein ATCC90586_002064 [Pythium insidiosum]|nr:hypothetical protein ATCC90586_002064 [Pythium insidiosum]